MAIIGASMPVYPPCTWQEVPRLQELHQMGVSQETMDAAWRMIRCEPFWPDWIKTWSFFTDAEEYPMPLECKHGSNWFQVVHDPKDP